MEKVKSSDFPKCEPENLNFMLAHFLKNIPVEYQNPSSPVWIGPQAARWPPGSDHIHVLSVS